MRPEPDIVSRIMKETLQLSEDFIWGFANLAGLIDPKFGDFTYGISIGKQLDPVIVDQISQGPTLEYYGHYREMNEELSRISHRVSSNLNKAGIPTWNITPSVTTEELDTVYSQTLRTEISHKMVATRAGLGWIGKTALFISNTFGPGVRLVTILTSYPLPLTGQPVLSSSCGACNLCVDACPAGAATGQLWHAGLDRDQFCNPWKCREQCTKFGEQFNENIRVCGICIAVCPVGV